MIEISEALAPYEKYRIKTESRAIVCMDDRPIAEAPSSERLPGVLRQGEKILYNQVAGGAAGIAFDHAVMHEIKAPGSVIAPSANTSLASRATFLSRLFGKNRIYLFNHIQCAAQLGAKEIAATMQDHFEELADYLEEPTPDIPRWFYEEAAEAAGNLAISPFFNMEPEESLLSMSCEPESESGRPITALELVDLPHQGSDLIMDRSQGVVFDTDSAFKEGNPAYYTSTGNYVRALQVNGIIIERALIEAPTILRHAAIARFHLQSPDGNPLDMHFIDSADK